MQAHVGPRRARRQDMRLSQEQRVQLGMPATDDDDDDDDDDHVMSTEYKPPPHDKGPALG